MQDGFLPLKRVLDIVNKARRGHPGAAGIFTFPTLPEIEGGGEEERRKLSGLPEAVNLGSCSRALANVS